MIVSFGSGRAGNLMFQLSGIAGARRYPQEKLVLVHFHKLLQLLPTLENRTTLLAVPERLVGLGLLFEKALNLAATSRIIGSIEETYPDSAVLIRRKGLFPIALFRGGWCQSESLISTSLLDELFEETVRESGGSASRTDVSDEGEVCFVHIRRGDYVHFPSPEYSAALPSCWYREQISRIADQHPGILFRFFSDDMGFVEKEFRDVVNSEFVDADNRESFISMASSDHGILSASSYSWWAAYFAHNRSHGTFVAPYFWSGWRLELWHPYEQVKSSFLDYARVDCSPA